MGDAGSTLTLAGLCAALRPRLGAAAAHLAPLEAPRPDEIVVPVAALVAPPILAETLAAYAAALGARDGRAAASMWAQYLFGALLAPPLAIACLTGRGIPASPSLVSVRLAVASREPRGIVATAPAPATGETIFALLDDWVFTVLAPLVRAVAVSADLGERILWSNAAVTATAVLDDLAAAGEAAAELGVAMTETLVWPGGRRNPLFRPYRAGAAGRVRRACCLRTALPRFERCKACPDGILDPVLPAPPRD